MCWKQVLLFTRAAAGISWLREGFVLQGKVGALPGWHGPQWGTWMALLFTGKRALLETSPGNMPCVMKQQRLLLGLETFWCQIQVIIFMYYMQWDL